MQILAEYKTCFTEFCDSFCKGNICRDEGYSELLQLNSGKMSRKVQHIDFDVFFCTQPGAYFFQIWDKMDYIRQLQLQIIVHKQSGKFAYL